jgi:hypothetical protein
MSRPRKHGQLITPTKKHFSKIALSAPTVYKKTLSKATPWSPLVEVCPIISLVPKYIHSPQSPSLKH